MASEREAVLTVRRILDQYGQLTVEARVLRVDDDLFARGMNGLAAVDVLLAAETAFGIVFPSSMMARSSVQTIRALLGCIRRLQAHPLAA